MIRQWAAPVVLPALERGDLTELEAAELLNADLLEVRTLLRARARGVGGMAPRRVFAAASKAFSEDHAACTAESKSAARVHPSTLREWAAGWDIGVSSASIYWAFTGHYPCHGSRRDAPYDSDDFGRCVRLIDIAPEWRERLDEVAQKVPAFAPLVPEWSRLEELYRAKRYQDLYAEIRRLRGRP